MRSLWSFLFQIGRTEILKENWGKIRMHAATGMRDYLVATRVVNCNSMLQEEVVKMLSVREFEGRMNNTHCLFA